MEKVEGIDVLSVEAGDFVKIDISVHFSRKLCLDLHVFKLDLQDYAQRLIKSYENRCD